MRLPNELCPNREARTGAIDLRRACHSTPLSQRRKVVVLTQTLTKTVDPLWSFRQARLITALAERNNIEKSTLLQKGARGTSITLS
jgi:hypothetical protein